MICENCNKDHNGQYGSGRFCSKECVRSFSTGNKRKEINDKVSETLKKKTLTEEHKRKISESMKSSLKNFSGKTHSEEIKRQIAQSVKEKSGINREVISLLQLSKRTITKIVHRMKLGCSRCGWNESTCDIHHIHGRKIADADNHENLTYLCPNCHRLVHTYKIKPEELVPLSKQVGDTWKKFYYWEG